MALPPLETFLAKLRASFEDDSFVHLTLTQLVEGSRKELISARLIELRGRRVFSIAHQEGSQSNTITLVGSEASDWIRLRLGTAFRSAMLHTTRRDWQLHIPAAGRPRLVAHKPAFTVAPARSHDESKHKMLNDSANDWLHGLGVTDAQGRVRPAMADKHRQINRYLEIFSHLAADCGWVTSSAHPPKPPAHSLPLPPTLTPNPASQCSSEPESKSKIEIKSGREELTLADMGCGKGYLTFGAWHLFQRVHGLNVRVLGVEARPDLVVLTNSLAKQIGAGGLEFQAGTIESIALPPVDALIALHACNTATDDAIRRGIELGAKLIVVAPCCHQELRPQLGKPEPLAPVLRHGIMEERMSEWLTDGLRALFLEWAGYRTKVFEFVSSEHTPKNLMIAAIREREPFADATARNRIVELKEFFDVQRHALDPLLDGTPPKGRP